MSDETSTARRFLIDSLPALEHIYEGLRAYQDALKEAEASAEQLQASEKFLSDLFMGGDQFSSNANHHFSVLQKRLQELKEKKGETELSLDERIQRTLQRLESNIETMASLAGAVLQISKQTLALEHQTKPSNLASRRIGSLGIDEIIWEGRNHAVHWEDNKPRAPVKQMLKTLENEQRPGIKLGTNNSLKIIDVLGWETAMDVLKDLEQLIDFGGQFGD